SVYLPPPHRTPIYTLSLHDALPIFGAPIGRWRNVHAAPENLSNDQLHSIGIVEGRKATIEFESGVIVSGRVEKIVRQDDRLLLRSEEHTSELQSPYDLVCRLLLEKK